MDTHALVIRYKFALYIYIYIYIFILKSQKYENKYIILNLLHTTRHTTHDTTRYDDTGEEMGAANFARRGPWPMINILRTHQVRAAQRGVPTGQVYITILYYTYNYISGYYHNEVYVCILLYVYSIFSLSFL